MPESPRDGSRTGFITPTGQPKVAQFVMENERSFDTTVIRQGHFLDLMQQLLDSTGQLAHCEKDPGMEIAPVANACRRHLLALQEIISSQRSYEEATQTLGQVLARNSSQIENLKEMLQSLIGQTEHCIAVLGRQLERTARELASLRSSKTAIRAYRGRQLR
jgi:hypothetical protein